MFCTRCGSTNHTSYDCSKPDQKFALPPEEIYVSREFPESKDAALETSRVPSKSSFVAAADATLTEPPRWQGGPPICVLHNLPAFKGKAELQAFSDKLCSKVLRAGKGQECGWWHAEHVPHSPSGDSSGHERTSKLPRGFVPFIRGQKKAAAELDLPQQKPASQKTLALPKRQAHKIKTQTAQQTLI